MITPSSARLATDWDRAGNTLTFQTGLFSTYAIAYKAGGTPSGSSGSSHDGGGEAFWSAVRENIGDTGSGVVQVDAGGFDQIPWDVMEALEKNSGVSLIIRWAGGESITIPAGMAQKNELGRIYWPLSRLAELYAGVKESGRAQSGNPETGGPGGLGPAADGTGTFRAPAPGQGAAAGPGTPRAVTPPDAGLAPDAAQGPAGPQAAKPKGWNPFAAVVILVAAGAAGVWYWKRRGGNQT